MLGLTKKQQEILAFIQDFIHRHLYSPSYREIMRHFGFSSLGSVTKHVHALKRKGFLAGEKQSSRSLYPIQTAAPERIPAEIELPFIGHLSAGLPIETFPHSQTLAVPDYLVQNREQTYVLRARGPSLQDEMIADGDLLVVEARTEAFEGELIVGLLSQNHYAAFVKKYYPEGNHIRLEGHTPRSQPWIVRHHDIQIQGAIVGLIRLFK